MKSGCDSAHPSSVREKPSVGGGTLLPPRIRRTRVYQIFRELYDLTARMLFKKNLHKEDHYRVHIEKSNRYPLQSHYT